jgi:CarD family transcriptional regulator
VALPASVRLAVGTVVVHPAHGVGRVSARDRSVIRGVEQDVAVIELDDGLSVTMPVQLAQELLRPPVGEPGLRQIRETLRRDDVPGEEVWSKRIGQTQEKLKDGDPLMLAEIVRDGARRERATQNSSSAKLSASERSLYARARELLSGEIGFVRGLSQAEANAWIDEQVAASQG